MLSSHHLTTGWRQLDARLIRFPLEDCLEPAMYSAQKMYQRRPTVQEHALPGVESALVDAQIGVSNLPNHSSKA